jgi:hypothetical protein
MPQKPVSEVEQGLIDLIKTTGKQMLRQDVYGDIALPLVFKTLLENLLEGEMYEGQLLELMIKYLKKYPDYKKVIDYTSLSSAIDKELNNTEWDIEDAKEEYEDLVKQLDELFF